jgi:hypothetical protein
MCQKKYAARYRSDLAVGNALPGDDGAPAIDGLYIYPEPQEQSREDGFVEFRVTAYGRSNIFSLDGITRRVILATYTFFQTQYDANGIISVESLEQNNSFNEIFTILGVLPASEPPTSLFVAPAISNPLVIPVNTDIPLTAGVETVVLGTSRTFRETNIYLTRDSFESRAFGRWSEYTVIWRARASVTEIVRPL